MVMIKIKTYADILKMRVDDDNDLVQAFHILQQLVFTISFFFSNEYSTAKKLISPDPSTTSRVP